MTTFELLDFTEAKEQVKVGRFSEALPKLYRLAGSYPQDQEIQDLIKLCLNMQQAQPATPVYSMPVPVYTPPQPQLVYVVNQPLKPDNTYKWLYLLPFASMLCIFGSIFLPWVTIQLTIDKINGELYFNGWGNVDGSAIMKEYLTPTNTALITSGAKGVTNLFHNNQNLLVVLGIMLIFLVIGPFTNKAPMPLLLLLGGLICGVIIGDEYVSISSFVSQGNQTLSKAITATQSGQFLIGVGVYLGFAGAVVCVVGSIILSSKVEAQRKNP